MIGEVGGSGGGGMVSMLGNLFMGGLEMLADAM